MGVPIVKGHTVPVLIVCSTPGGLRRLPVSSVPVSCGKGTVRLALYGRQLFIWVLSHAFPPFSVAVLPERISGVGTLPDFGTFVPKWLVAVLPLPRYSFSDGHSFFKVQLIDELP